MDAKVVWCLNSGDIVNPSMGIRARLPVSHAPESRHHTPSALWESMEQWFQKYMHGGRQVLVVVVTIRTVSNRDVAPEPPMDGFTGVS